MKSRRGLRVPVGVGAEVFVVTDSFSVEEGEGATRSVVVITSCSKLSDAHELRTRASEKGITRKTGRLLDIFRCLKFSFIFTA